MWNLEKQCHKPRPKPSTQAEGTYGWPRCWGAAVKKWLSPFFRGYGKVGSWEADLV